MEMYGFSLSQPGNLSSFRLPHYTHLSMSYYQQSNNRLVVVFVSHTTRICLCLIISNQTIDFSNSQSMPYSKSERERD